MILGMTMYTFVHVFLSLLGITAGLIVLSGLLIRRRFDLWTAIFLSTTIATSVTGFGFPVNQLLPSHIVGIISLVVLAVAVIARYRFQLAGHWRWLYVVNAVIALHLNVFVLIVQLFIKVPALHALAPTQTEPPFAMTQAVVLLLFFVLAIVASLKFRNV